MMADDADLARLRRERQEAASIEAGRPVGPGRLTPRQRVLSLVEEGSFFELGALAASQQPGAIGPTPGDGVVTGFGSIGGHQVAVLSEDPLVLARTDGQVAKSKRRRLLKLALQQQLPVVVFADGPQGPAPAFPVTGGELFGGITEQYDDADLRSRNAPLIGVIAGPSSGQVAEILAESDVVIATSDVEHGERGGPEADIVVAEDGEAIRVARLLVRLDAHRAGEGSASPLGTLSGVPSSEVIAEQLADAGTSIFFARSPGSGLVGGLLRLGGIPVVIAVTGGWGQRLLLRSDVERLLRLAALSRRYSIPLLLVQDCDGYAPDFDVDRSSAAALATLVASLRSLPAPVVCLVAGAGHVLGTYCLGGRQIDPSYVLAWPWARIGVTDTPAYDARTLDASRQPDPWLAAGLGLVDDVITPEETGSWLRWFVRLASDRGHLAPIPVDRRWYARSSIKGT
jgi:acetyl-CoA carboxylase carboxyltransferase component